MTTVNNLTNPGQPPVTGDTIQTMGNTYSVIEQFYAPVPPTTAEVEDGARQWRDSELATTDWIMPVTDHPDRAAYVTYREELRQWPSTPSFPDTKPILGV
jgi:hypothetical protein